METIKTLSELIIAGEPIPFAKPIAIAGVNYTHFKMRESTIDDLFEAELALAPLGAGTNTPLRFNGQLMTMQLTSVSNAQGGKFEGPFTMNMLRSWGRNNYNALRNVQFEVDLLGESVSSNQDQALTASS
jgi:phage FluMu protein gp41